MNTNKRTPKAPCPLEHMSSVPGVYETCGEMTGAREGHTLRIKHGIREQHFGTSRPANRIGAPGTASRTYYGTEDTDHA